MIFLILVHLFALEQEEEEEAEDSGDSDEEVGLDYLSKDIGSVRSTNNEHTMR